MTSPSVDRARRCLGPALRGHLLRFGRRKHPAYSSASGVRLLLIFVTLELVLGPRLSLLPRLGAPMPASWLSLPLLFLGALVAARTFAGMSPDALGFLGWARWTRTEGFYVIQVLVLANLVFGFAFRNQLGGLGDRPELWRAAASILLLQLTWGFYQELMYRGILQTELTRRLGEVWGPVTANLLFTFGPLHAYHFGAGLSPVATSALFGAIFAIGLFFAVLFHRTRNLWIVGLFHGVGNAYTNGAPALAELMD